MSNIRHIHFGQNSNEWISIDGLMLYQIGDYLCESGHEAGAQHQLFYELIYVVSGSGSWQYGAKTDPLGKGTLCFSPKGERFHLFSDGEDPLHILYLEFDLKDSAKGEWRDLVDQLSSLSCRVSSGSSDFSPHFYSLLNELLFERKYYDLFLKNTLENLMIIAYRTLAQENALPYARPNSKDGLVFDILYFINSNIRTLKQVEEVAAAFGYSYNYIARRFMQVLGQTMKDYLMERKFEVALDLLNHSEGSISEIANELSFSSLHTFSRAFRRQFGCSPKEYREQHPVSVV